jgi:NADH:ubiquinone oxidoreductase subunit F (NADH-binding)
MGGATPAMPRITAGWRRNGAISLEEHLELLGPVPVPESRGRSELVAEVERSGLVGRGGGGFPVGVKMRAVAGARKGKRMVVANGAEGEPASRKDQVLLARAPHLVLDGAALAAAAVGAGEVVVCVKRDAVAALSAVQLAAGERASSESVELSVVEVPTDYVAGEESALVNYLNTGRPAPTFVPPRPFERGVDGRPTLVQNVETLAHLALIARHGAEWFRSVGKPEDPGSNLVTLSGSVTVPGVYEVPSGLPLRSLLEHAGGTTAPLGAFLVGGYAGSWCSAERAMDQQLDRVALGSDGGRLGAGVVVALPATACGVCEAARVTRFLATASARQCGPCLYGLASVAEALEEISDGVADPGTHLWIEKWVEDIAGRGACGHPDGAVRFVASAVATFTDELREHESGGGCRGTGGSWVLPLPERARVV